MKFLTVTSLLVALVALAGCGGTVARSSSRLRSNGEELDGLSVSGRDAEVN